jgi:hypothetical protein
MESIQSVQVKLTQASLEGVALAQVSLQGRRRGQVIEGDASAADGKGGVVSAKGRWDRAARTIELEARAAGIDLALLRALARREDSVWRTLEGRLASAELRVEGPLDGPTGRLDGLITGARIDLTDDFVLAMPKIVVAARLDGDRVHVERLEIDTRDRGHVSAPGTIRLDGVVPSAFEVRRLVAQKLRLVIGGLPAELKDLDGRIAGRRAGRDWTLDARVRGATIETPKSGLQSTGPLADVVFIDKREIAALRSRLALGITRSAVSAPPARLELHVELPPPDASVPGVHLKQSELDTWLSGSVAVHVAEEVTIEGYLEKPADKKGTYSILGRRWTIRILEVTLDGSVPIDPILEDAVLVRDAGDATVFIQAQGRISELMESTEDRVEYRAEPDIYDEAQLLGIIGGVDPDRDTDESQSTRPIEVTAAGVASSIVANQLRLLLGKVYPLDVLGIEHGNDGMIVGGRLGEWFTSWLYAGYRYRSTTDPRENTHEGTAQIEISRLLRLDLRAGNRSQSADLLFIFRW